MPSVSELASRFDQLKEEAGRDPVRRAGCRHLLAHTRGFGRQQTSAWAEIPPDIMRLVVDLLPLHDVQSTLLVCREWHDGFANGLLELKPRQLRVSLLATRYKSHTWQTSQRIFLGNFFVF